MNVSMNHASPQNGQVEAIAVERDELRLELSDLVAECTHEMTSRVRSSSITNYWCGGLTVTHRSGFPFRP